MNDAISELAGLADRVEKLEGPDREVDALIAAALRIGTEHEWALNYPAWEGRPDGRVYLERGGPSFAAPLVTASLDAVMSLVPEGMMWVGGDSPSRKAAMTVCPDGEADGFPALAATPALALTAACLRAHLASLAAAMKGEG